MQPAVEDGLPLTYVELVFEKNNQIAYLNNLTDTFNLTDNFNT
ncbi:MAG: hypothetical protein V3580_04570 [Candidatus Cardinium sp.]